MKTTETRVPKALSEVWEWKRLVQEDTEGMTAEQLRAYLHEKMEEAARCIGAQLVENADGTYMLV